jgi:predicted ATP-grasp superfamily ATP-dependent carboligase
MPEQEHLVVVGVCARYLTASAHRAGYRVTAADGFGDLDTLAAAQRLVAIPGAGVDALTRSVVALAGDSRSSSGLVYGGGFEGRPDLLRRLARHFELFGNPASTIALLAEPRRFFSLLEVLEIPTPEVRYQRPAASTGWLLKHAASNGGMGVYRAGAGTGPAETADSYFQRQVSGPVVSALFAANGRESVTLGFNRLTSCVVGDRPFCYSGAITDAGLDAVQQERICGYIRRLTRALRLRGINGLDLMLEGDTPLLLELNPRPTATLELYDQDLPGGGLATHVAACQGRLPEQSPDNVGLVRGSRVLYAPCPLEVPALRWPAWCQDRPVAGSRIPAGAPVCTLYARGQDGEEVESRLEVRCRGLLRLFAGPDRKAA